MRASGRALRKTVRGGQAADAAADHHEIVFLAGVLGVPARSSRTPPVAQRVQRSRTTRRASRASRSAPADTTPPGRESVSSPAPESHRPPIAPPTPIGHAVQEVPAADRRAHAKLAVVVRSWRAILLPLSIDDWRLTIGDLLAIRRLWNCVIRLRIAALRALTIGGITIFNWEPITNRHFSGSRNRQCWNRQSNGAIRNRRIVSESSIVIPQSPMDAGALAQRAGAD